LLYVSVTTPAAEVINLFGAGAFFIARWDGSTWASVGGSGPYPEVLAIGRDGVYLGGRFTTVGGISAKGIARWNGRAWSNLASHVTLGMDDTVGALTINGTTVYAGGWFVAAGGVTANHIAGWSDSAWASLGDGFPYPVLALASNANKLYASSSYPISCYGPPCPIGYIAQWDGGSWSKLGTVNGSVTSRSTAINAILVSDDKIYIGGNFASVDNVPAQNIARWDGSSWAALGSGVDGPVTTLAISGTNLYAGGSFTTAGGSPTRHIARWDGSGWAALGDGVDGPVAALAVSGTNLYAGGSFTTAGGSPTRHIARWDGSGWAALGSGVDGPVAALAVSGEDVYLGGSFTSGGGKPSYYFAHWNDMMQFRLFPRSYLPVQVR
jgi:hypothetical protein